jgi:AraC family transcriptional regulator, transcriptional activator FtrA
MSKVFSRKTRKVAILVADGSNPFEMSVAMEVFGLRRPELLFQPYDLTVCAAKRRVRLRDGVFDLHAPGSLDDALKADTIVVPNRPDPLAGQSTEITELIRAAHKRKKRLVGFCTGAFTLAEAGVLNAKRAVTHWRWAEEFGRLYPKVVCVPNVLYTQDGNVFTAAGSASALDLCLHIVRLDFGAEVAHSISRRLVFAVQRAGDQAQFAETNVKNADDDGLTRLLDRIRLTLGDAHTVATMASHVAMAPSTFHRQFLSHVGVPPMQWLIRERVDAARRLLESTNATVDSVARQVGLGTSTNLRLHCTGRSG